MVDAIVASVISGLIIAGVTALVFNRIAKRQEAHQALICSRFEVDDAQDEVLIATAIAVRDGKCNGEMTAALEKMKKAKQKQAEIMHEQIAANF